MPSEWGRRALDGNDVFPYESCCIFFNCNFLLLLLLLSLLLLLAKGVPFEAIKLIDSSDEK